MSNRSFSFCVCFIKGIGSACADSDSKQFSIGAKTESGKTIQTEFYSKEKMETFYAEQGDNVKIFEINDMTESETKDIEFFVQSKMQLGFLKMKKIEEYVKIKKVSLDGILSNLVTTRVVDFGDGMKARINILVKGFGKPKEENPFYKIFSPEYQMDPIMRIIFSFLTHTYMLTTITSVSKHIQKIVKEFKINDLEVDVCDFSNLCVICEKYKLQKISIKKFNFNEEKVGEKNKLMNSTLNDLEICSCQQVFTEQSLYKLINTFKGLNRIFIDMDIMEYSEMIQRKKGVLEKITNIDTILNPEGEDENKDNETPNSDSQNTPATPQNPLDILKNLFVGATSGEEEKLETLKRHDNMKGVYLFGEIDPDFFYKLYKEFYLKMPAIEMVATPKVDLGKTTRDIAMHIRGTQGVLWRHFNKVEEEKKENVEKVTEGEEEVEKKKEGEEDEVQEQTVEEKKEIVPKKKIPIMSHPIRLKYKKDCLTMDIVWRCFMLGTSYQRKKFHGSDSLFIYSKNPVSVPKFKIFVVRRDRKHGVVVKRTFPSKFLPFGFGRYLHDFGKEDFEEEDVELDMFIVLEDLQDLRQYEELKMKVVDLKQVFKKKDQTTFECCLGDFDLKYDKTRVLHMGVELNELDWEVTLDYNPKTNLFCLYFALVDANGWVINADVVIRINEVEKGFVGSTFKFGGSTGWGHIQLNDSKKLGEKFKVNIVIYTDIISVISKADYEKKINEQKEAFSKKFLEEKDIMKGKVGTKEIVMTLPSYKNSVTEEFKCVGIPWKINFNREWGKFHRSSFYVSPEFEGSFLIYADYTLKISGTNYEFKSAPVWYYARRGWGFDELDLGDFSFSNKGIYTFNIEIKIFDILTTEEYQDRCFQIVKSIQPKVIDSIEIELKSKDEKNSFQTECFNLNGIPFIGEVFPIGMDVENKVSLFFYHEMFNFEIYAKYTLEFQHEDKIYKKEVEEKEYSIKFPGFCPIGICVNKKIKFTMEVISVSEAKII